MENKTDKPHFHVTAGLLWREGKFLLTRRPLNVHLGGLWEFPGGKQEAHETLEECLEREIREELGIMVHADRLIVSIGHEYEEKSITLHLFTCSSFQGDPRPLECEEMKWVRPEDLDAYPLPPPDLKMIPWIKASLSEFCLQGGRDLE